MGCKMRISFDEYNNTVSLHRGLVAQSGKDLIDVQVIYVEKDTTFPYKAIYKYKDKEL